MSLEPILPVDEKSSSGFLKKTLKLLIILALIGLIVACLALFFIYKHYSKDLPDHQQLSDYDPPTVTRLYANDGQMLAEYAEQKRLFIPIEAIPNKVKNAFISAEDKNFYQHKGVDIEGLSRAILRNIKSYFTGGSMIGGSTITQQVVKNFLLTNERSIERKIKEAILAFRINDTLSKDEVLELYLNEIFLGNRSYGVAAAALNYFNKSLNELTVEEAATLAALPKAPSRIDPTKYPEKALNRRNWVINRMLDDGYLTKEQAEKAIATPINLVENEQIELINATFFTDAVRKELIENFTEEKVYNAGYTVRTTLNPQYQKIAEESLLKGIINYDKRHGWRGAIARGEKNQTAGEILASVKIPPLPNNWQIAIVSKVDAKSARIIIADGSEGKIPLKYLKWARKYIGVDSLGKKITKASQVLKKRHVIAVKPSSKDGEYHLMQVPKINGAIVAQDPHTGKVLAMVGGYNYAESQFNRVTQARRQPGSSFKPFVYLAAFENGFAPNSIIVDEEIQLQSKTSDLRLWTPKNSSGKYYGPTTLRVGLEKSRNAMTVRLTDLMGLDKVVNISKRLHIFDNPQAVYSLSLGSEETTLMKLTSAYSMMVNGGKEISSAIVEHVQDRKGKIIYRRDERNCQDCVIRTDNNIEVSENDDDFAKTIKATLNNKDNQQLRIEEINPPLLADERAEVINPINAYQVVSTLEGAIQRGTAASIRQKNITLAGKTGTTNDTYDAWFVGFSPDLVVGVFIGFDKPETLGRREYASKVAAPIWANFMKKALKDKADIPFRRPDGVKLVKIDLKSGLLPSPSTPSKDIIYEAFKDGQEPNSYDDSYSFENNNFNNDNDNFDYDFNSPTTGGVY